MSAQPNAPIIIKKVKKAGGEAHHGGAWKVAYADFVTAMMAFFLLMWLLNATTEKQRKGIADYFAPTVPVNRVSGGGDGAFDGDSVFAEETLARSGTGATLRHPADARSATGDAGETDRSRETEDLEKLGDVLAARAGESMVSDLAQRHVLTRVTDEGLVVELFDTADEPLFNGETDAPTEVMTALTVMIASVFKLAKNGVAVNGHVQAQPVVLAENTGWALSAARAAAAREILENAGLVPTRVKRVSGHADRTPAAGNPMAPRNNRIELILLRSDQ